MKLILLISCSLAVALSMPYPWSGYYGFDGYPWFRYPYGYGDFHRYYRGIDYNNNRYFKNAPYQNDYHAEEPIKTYESKLRYYGKIEGECESGYDGLYYVDEYSFAYCTSGQKTLQPCADGAANPPEEQFTSGGYYGFKDFCSINLLAHGYRLPGVQPQNKSPKVNERTYGRHKEYIYDLGDDRRGVQDIYNDDKRYRSYSAPSTVYEESVGEESIYGIHPRNDGKALENQNYKNFDFDSKSSQKSYDLDGNTSSVSNDGSRESSSSQSELNVETINDSRYTSRKGYERAYEETNHYEMGGF